jgi:hypothetical protein
MQRRKCGTRRKRRSGGADVINPAPYPSSITAEGSQPSNEIMEWATTAGIPTPAKMQNVAHGGKRSKRSTRRKRHGKRSMKRSRKHRGGTCGPCGLRP